MKRKTFVRRVLTMMLSLAMVFTSVNIPSMTVMASEAVALEAETENATTAMETKEMIANGDFASDGENWSLVLNKDDSGEGAATVSYDGETGAVVSVTDVGGQNFHVQMKQSGLNLETGKQYVVKLYMESDVDRRVEFSCQGNESTNWAYYGGATVDLIANQAALEEPTITHTIDMTDKATDTNADFIISLGKIASGTSVPGNVTIKSVSVQPVTTDESGDSDEGSGDETGSDTELPGDDNGENDNNGDDENDKDIIMPDMPQLSEGYSEYFVDSFDGEALDETNWNRELRDPGWTNQELQEYTASTDNAYVTDGKLVIQAIKTEAEDGSDYYTSAKLTTKNKVDFTYGKIEASIRVPSGGQGLWPAFWMMPTNEQFYGTWPKCGEIDIMEVLGHEPAKAYQTLHWGDPHAEKQGTMTLAEGTFASDYHIFAVEWLPGEIIYTIDGVETHRANDWFTRVEGYDKATFPAPFDQDFFLQLNLAVGGTWPGNPDETTVFGDGAQMAVDWVRVSRMSDEAYEQLEENVSEPSLREPDANGNYVINGDFAVEEDLTDANDWQFLAQNGGTGEAFFTTDENNNPVLKIDTTNESANEHEQVYSIQLVQPSIPMEQGKEYVLSFEAKADEERQMVVDISAPLRNWVRYLADTTLTVGTDWDTYEYTFSMTGENDASARLEFCLGKLGSVADVYLRNVTLKQTGNEAEVELPAMLPDGNYVRNGEFESGEGRLGYWTVNTGETGATVSVTNTKVDGTYVRELKVVGNETVTNASDVTLSQSDLALTADSTYVFSVDAYANEAATVSAVVAGTTYELPLTTEKTNYSFKLTTPAELTNTDIVLNVGSNTTIYMDNVSVKEDALLLNGSFDNGTTAWTMFADATNTSGVTYGVVTENGDNVMQYYIPNTGSLDWYIQLQNAVKLEKGKTYKLTFNAKSSMDRQIKYAFQRNGNLNNDDWTAYSDTKFINLTNEWQETSLTFTMNKETDSVAQFCVSMGAVSGQITTPHYVYLDDFVLVETEPDTENPEETPDSKEMIVNGDFANDGEGWKLVLNSDDSGAGAATVSYEGETGAVVSVTDVGGANYHVQMKQSGLNLESGKQYVVKIYMESDVDRRVEFSCQGGESTNWAYYGGTTVDLLANQAVGEEPTITHTIDMTDKTTDSNADFIISLGKIASGTSVPGNVTIKSVSVQPVATEGDGDGSEEGGSGEDTEPQGEMMKNSSFEEGITSWSPFIQGTAEGEYKFENGNAIFDITNVGGANWHIQLKQGGLNLVKGQEYVLNMKIRSEESRHIEYSFMDSTSSSWYAGGKSVLTGNDTLDTVKATFTMGNDTNKDAYFILSLGQITDDSGNALNSPACKVTVESVSLMLKSEADLLPEEPTPTPDPDEADDDNPDDSDVPDGLWAEKIEDEVYTGKALKPEVTVYDGDTLLVKNKDYTVSYKNHTKAYIYAENEDGFDAEKAPKVIIKGKGNYTGSIEKYFVINPKKLGDADIVVDNLYVNAPTGKNPKEVTPKPVVTRDGKKLKLNKDYVVAKVDTTEGAYIKPGTYNLEIVPAENSGYTGKKEITITLADKSEQILMSKVSVSSIKSQSYTGAAIEPEITVKYKGTSLTKGEKADYTVSYSNNTEIGTATVTITGTGAKYVGTKKVSFKITGKKLTAGMIKGVPKSVEYTGEEICPVITVTDVSADNYTVEYEKNTDPGKATIIVKGIKNYSGTVKKTFTIAKYDIKKNNANVFKVVSEDIKAVYAKGGSKPTVEVTFNGQALTEGVDYTLSYANNKAVEGKKQPVISVKGKGKFKGTVSGIPFTIEKQKLGNLNAKATDILVKSANKYDKVNPTITDLDGKALKKGTDYTITGYTYADDSEISGTPIVGATIKVTAEGKGNYEGTISTTFRVIANDKNISKVKVKVTDQYYTGQEIKPAGEEVYVYVIVKEKEGKKTVTKEVQLTEGTDYEIVEDSYTKNIAKGTGKMVIQGLGEYGGTKTVSFKIKAQTMNWAEGFSGMSSWLKSLFE